MLGGAVHLGPAFAVDKVADGDRGGQVGAQQGGVPQEAKVDDADLDPSPPVPGGVPGRGV